MSKAEERALERCPKSENVIEEMRNEKKRAIFTEGYHQAEKDLELTWEDIESIHTLIAHQEVTPFLWKCGNEAFYKEVLKRFKERKEK